MRVRVRTATLPLVRTGVFSSGGLVIVGVLGLAFAFQRYRASRRKSLVVVAQAEQQKLQQPAGEGDSQSWSANSPAVQSQLKLGKDQIHLLSEVLPLSPKELWKLIYSPTFIRRFQDQQGLRDTQNGEWGKSGGKLVKRSQYIKPLKKNTFGPREAFTEEECVCQQRVEGGFRIAAKAFTRKVPYGNNFHVELQWIATREAEGKTRLEVVGGIVFSKRVIVGGIIKKATLEGLRETYDAYREYLLHNIDQGKQQKRNSDGQAPQPRASNLRTASTAARIVAEDLTRNGIFISWGQLLCYLLVSWFCLLLLKLSWSRGGRLLSFDKWDVIEASVSLPVLLSF